MELVDEWITYQRQRTPRQLSSVASACRQSNSTPQIIALKAGACCEIDAVSVRRSLSATRLIPTWN